VAELLRELDTLRRDVDKTGTLEGLNTFKAQALEDGDGRTGSAPPSTWTGRTRDCATGNGRHLYGQGALLARRLVEAGQHLCHDQHRVTGTTTTTSRRAWKSICRLWTPPSRPLTEDLEDRGMLDDVVVYCAGEFGRTPADQRPRGAAITGPTVSRC